MQQKLENVQVATVRLRQIPEYHITRPDAEKIGQTSAEPDAKSGGISKMTKAMRVVARASPPASAGSVRTARRLALCA